MILNALMRRPRSMAEHSAIMDERDIAQQRNALMQMQMQQAQQGMQRQAARDNALRQYGMTEQGANALMQLGDVEGATKLVETLRAQEAARGRQQYMQGLAPVRPIQANAVSGVTGPRPEALSVVGQRKKFDPAEMLAAGFQPKEVAETQALVSPTKKVKEYTDERTPDGRVIRTALMEDGTVQRTDVSPFIKPEIKNTGRSWTAIDLVSGQARNVAPITMTAAEAAADSRARQGLALQRQRLEFERGQGVAEAGGANQAGLSKTFGKAPAGYRWKPDGSMERIPGGPADEKATAGDVGKGTVNDVVASLRDMYNQLDEAGGITNPERGALGNLAAGIASSDTGQAAGRLFGTQNQSLRNTIAQQRPVLLQAIMKATGMSAKQMDSNAELKLYLATATDPTLDVASNKRALDMIEQLYGKGSGAKPLADPGKPAAGPKPTVSNW